MIKSSKIKQTSIRVIGVRESLRLEFFVKYLHYLSFGVLLFISSIYLYNTYKSNKFQIQYEAQILLNGFSSEINGKLNERIILTKSLAAFVKQTKYSDPNNPLHIVELGDSFNTYTNSLHNEFDDILSLQLAPAGNVTYVTNLERNQAAVGHDLFVDDQRREQVISAIKSRNNIVSGPLSLIQGGEAIIARQAIFTTEGTFNTEAVISSGRANESDAWLNDIPSDFWGFATVIIDSRLIEDTIENWSDDNFNLAIRGRHGLGSLGEVFEGSEDVFEESIAEVEIKFDGGSWNLAVSSNVPYFKPNDVGFFVFAILISLTISLFIKNLTSERRNLTSQAQTDALTNTFNRHKIKMDVQNYIEQYRRYGLSFSIIMFDIDHFKSINDNFGHMVGDVVLKDITDLISNNIRKTDTFGRYGGEEFIILCPNTTEKEAIALAEKLRAILSDTSLQVVGKVTASFGVASISENDSIDSLYQRADDGIYQAKNNGRNSVCVVPTT